MDGLTLRAEDLGLSDEALERVKAGEPIAITRGGQLFAQISAPIQHFTPPASLEARRANTEAMLAKAESLMARGLSFTQAEIRAMRDDHDSEPD